ncbi:MAG: bifunctional riboflavin kinase/FAD synthetase [Chloroflexi bacterium]|nr:bifunctional riboflavin kinase/FAD synthetase [Chloroflexota bacterium]
MNAEAELSRHATQRPTVLSVGVFDGVHLGHQALLALLRAEAARRGYAPGVVTFTTHPRAVLNPSLSLRYITPLAERLRLLQGAGMECLVPITFTQELSRLSAREFVELLRRYLNMQGMVVGPGFALGHQRQGTEAVLRQIGEEMGFFVRTVEPLVLGGERVSSTAIRNGLEKGDVAGVARLLGRRFRLTGVVVRGEGRGASLLGFPTANLQVPAECITPADGIYATWALADGQWHKSATSIGVRPTFDGQRRTIEAFVMDFSGDLYSRELSLGFAARLRDEQRFDSPEALRQQMERDVEQARRVLDSASPM